MRRQPTIFNPLWSLVYPLRRLSGSHAITIIAVQPRYAPDVEAAVLEKLLPIGLAECMDEKRNSRSALGLA